jgi:hypothetical protein
MNELDRLVDEILRDGLDDWMMLVSIVRTAEEAHPGDQAATRTAARELVVELVEKGWMVPGDLTDSGFEQWDLLPATSVRRILDDLDAHDWDVTNNVIAWFANTPEGDRRAQGKRT